PHLRLVQLLSAGAEQFAGRLPEGVVLCNARGAHTPSTAEWAVTATLAAQRGIPGFVREQDAGRWSPSTQRSVVGARVLVVGAGGIGRRIARMLAGFDVYLTYVARIQRAARPPSSPTSSAASSPATPSRTSSKTIEVLFRAQAPCLSPKKHRQGVGEGMRPPERAARRGRSRVRSTGSRTSVLCRVTSQRSP